MRILQTVAGVWEGTGGPAASIPLLCAALAARGHEVTLLIGKGPTAEAVRALPSTVTVVQERLGPYWMGNYSTAYARRCDELASCADILHTHGMWLHPNAVTAWSGRRHSKPFVVSTRGMLSGWAMDQGRWRKRLAWHLFQRGALERAAFLHATSADEESDIRRLRLSPPVGVIPNGLDLSGFDAGRLAAWRRDGRRKQIVFVSRIHPVKGLDLLLSAWASVRQAHPDARLAIAGPGEETHVGALRAALARDGGDDVSYLGAVEGEAKLALMATARALVLPSRSESYGMVVAEALACGTPVIATMAVPWPELESSQCGWRVEPDRQALADAIDAALRASEAEIGEMGARGRAVVEESHTAEAAAGRLESVYSWLCGREERPSFASQESVSRGGAGE